MDLVWVALIVLRAENEILRKIAIGEPIADVASALCREAEAKLPDLVCVVARIDRAGLLRFLAAPSLSDDFIAAIETYLDSPDGHACSASEYVERPFYFTELQTDAGWCRFRDFYSRSGFRAYWSYPSFSENGTPIGLLGVYAREPREPTPHEIGFIDRWRELCEIALRCHQHADDGERLALTDALTGLPNRTAFEASFVGLGLQSPGSWGMFVIDLDNLKTVNDVFGHKAGDHLIRTAGHRIAEAVAPDVTYRIGGDEFVVVVRQHKHLADLNEAAQAILSALDVPADCDGQSVIPAGTIGGAVFDSEDCSPAGVYQNADFALFHAKETGRGGFVRYWPGIDTRMTRRRSAVRDVAEALEEGRIEAVYQPVVQLDTRKVIGMEALCRLRLPTGELVSASEFKDAMTDAKVATDLTTRMLARVTDDLACWRARNLPLPEIVLNVTTADFYTGDLLRKLEVALGAIDLPLAKLTLDVSEDVAAGRKDKVVSRQIARLRRHGVRVALDEFGRGQASLTHLIDMSVDEIVIARSFVERLWPNDPALVVVQGLIAISRELDIRVVAQGIETEVQASQLWAMGCRYGQGYAFSRPLDREGASELLHRHGLHVTGSIPVGSPQPNETPRPARKRA